MRRTLLPLLAGFSMLATAALHAQTLPLVALPDDAERDHWLPEQVNDPAKLAALLEITGSAAVPFSGTQDRPIEIAMIYPSADVSDFWARNYLAMIKRLDELGIKYKTTEFASRQIEHELQSTYATQVVQDADQYDYIVFGPSELATQGDNIEKLANTEGFVTYVWAFHTPLKYFSKQPAMWFDFSSAVGAQVMCDYML
ncbi:MAG TPA: ribose ABC transporter substrate-binding protein, partial [Methylomirabilota bacterium]|nr:ribose ABC transporter substrate-binding protein [Methylomirabilota bacterium]